MNKDCVLIVRREGGRKEIERKEHVRITT